jgi:putative ABC transport system permease protein
MLFGDRAKYIGLIFGVAFATLLITQQSALFVGLMQRTVDVIDDAAEVDIWVMSPEARYVERVRPLRDTAPARVRGVRGVAWAVPLYKATAPVRTLEGLIENAQLLGVDDASLLGVPQHFRMGSAADLLAPDAIAVDVFGYHTLWPGAPLRLGRELELNDRRAVVAAITEALPGFTTNVIIHTRYSLAVNYVPVTRDQLSFVLARAAPGEDPGAVARRITAVTGLQALTSAAFRWKTIVFFLRHTGIPVNFAIVILLGVVVGGIVVGLTFSLFVADNIRHYAALKAMGVDNHLLARLVLLQALVVASIGYSFGLAMSAGFFSVVASGDGDFRHFNLPGWIALAAAALIGAIVLSASLASLRRVWVVDPAIVFR